MSSISEALAAVRQRIRAAEERFHREAHSVKLLAVSKRKPVEAIRAAHEAGQVAFGENHLQEALPKVEALAGLRLEWHFIGHVQTNKTRAIAAHFDWVQSVDRLKVAQRLNDQRDDALPPLNVCLQVNVSEEESKSGEGLARAPEIARAIAELPRLRLRGLMAIPQPEEDFEAQRIPFRRVRDAFEALNADGFALDTLSLGMTADMEAAIAEGSTMVRIGTAIFGARESA